MKKKLNIAIQMDPLENLNLKGDTTFALAMEAQNRSFNLSHFTPNDVFYISGKVFASTKKLNVFFINDIKILLIKIIIIKITIYPIIVDNVLLLMSL